MPESPYPMLPVSEALAMVLAYAEPLAAARLPLDQVQGRILAQDVFAREPLPPFAAAVKDGYAVVAADGPGLYPVVGDVTAGRLAEFDIKPGQVAYITTGAPMPVGADAVVMVEWTEAQVGEDGRPWVLIRQGVQAGDDVRQPGVDVADGQLVLTAGERLGAAEVGLLATVGAVDVLVYPQPRVAILSTGDELVEPGQRPGPGQIRDSNRAMLTAAVRAAGGKPVDMGIGGDSQEQISTAISAALGQSDVLLTSGGVSMGELDLIKPLLAHTGTVHFGRMRMKPGKPLTFATAQVDGRTKLIFGLPGNPVSSLVTFYLVAVPALRALSGWPDPHLTRVQARLAQSLAMDPERPEYHRANLRWDVESGDGAGGFVAISTGSQASSRLLSMRSANALLEIPLGTGNLPAGTAVSALLIGDL